MLAIHMSGRLGKVSYTHHGLSIRIPQGGFKPTLRSRSPRVNSHGAYLAALTGVETRRQGFSRDQFLGSHEASASDNIESDDLSLAFRRIRVLTMTAEGREASLMWQRFCGSGDSGETWTTSLDRHCHRSGGWALSCDRHRSLLDGLGLVLTDWGVYCYSSILDLVSFACTCLPPRVWSKLPTYFVHWSYHILYIVNRKLYSFL
ncbi:hypothetical protein BDW59DRAFT_18877 [Aspergillus cavernicola]|uniref:Uncharacterized protein n=1 Tax=Aspergillus cavernicola TaxID=176166 RepID=A0ABR4IS45_9EURO